MDEDDDIAGFLVNEERRAQGRVFASLDDDPEKGARALQLSDATGVPPAVVHGDLEHYDNQTKARMSGQLVSTNDFLKGYINSHDLAATVSNDDLGQLDAASQAIQKISPRSVLGKMGEAFKAGFDAEGQDKELKDLWNFVDSPVWKAAVINSAPSIYAARTVKQAMALFNASVYAGAAGIGEAANQITGSEAWGKRLTRDMIQLAQVGLSGQSGFHLHPTVAAQIGEAARVGKATQMYSAVGKEAPVGTHPFLDKVKEGQAEVDGENLKEALKESASSATRERSPELYAAFVRQHVGDAKIGISAEKVAELYGEKAPTPDDNILGWIPRIAEQLETAKGTGLDIEVPLADFLARVDPKIAKELEDHVRMRPEGVTREEGKLAKEGEEPVPEAEPSTPVDVVRKTSGLEPFETLSETIKSAAIKVGDQIFEGTIHAEAFEKASKALGREIENHGEGGFLTSEGRYVSRKEAQQIAEQASQIKEGVLKEGENALELSAEDLKSAKFPIRQKPKQLEMEFPKQLDERDPFQRGTLIGVADYDRYLRLIEQRQAEDLAYATKKAEALARKQMTAAWKEDEAAIRQQVVEDLNRQPVFSADTFFRDGMFADEKIAGSHRIGTDFLAPEEQAALPPSFYAKNGLDPDGVAWRFGYSSGQDMINDLAGLHAQREASGKNNMAFRREAIDSEVARRMEKKYGEAKKGLLEEAKDQALSDTQIDLLHEETLGMAMKAGVEFELTKGDIAAMVKERIDATLMGDVSSDKMLAAAGRAGRAEASALLKEDYAEAFRQRALKEIDAIMAKQAMELEKAREKFDATAKRFRARSLASVAQEYTNFIHDILLRVGEPVNRSVQDLAAEIQREGYTDLGGFVKGKSDQTFGMLNIPIPDFLLDPNFRKPVDQMTTVEFREMHEAVAAMAKLGRDETKIIRAGESADRAEVVAKMKEELQTFPLKEYDAVAPKTLSPTNIFRTALASTTNLETLLNRWDRNDPRGVFNRYIVYPLAEAANRKNTLTREFSKPYSELGPVPNAKKVVTSPIIDPLSITKENPEGRPLPNFNMGNVQVMIHNAGNEAQWIKFAKGWGADPDALMSWLHHNSTKEMWDRAQKMGDTIFKPAFEQAQAVYHQIYGIAPEKIELRPVQTPFGEYAGWYHPLIKDPIKEVYIDADGKRISGQSKAQQGGGVYDNTDNFHARTTNGYTKSRTNAYYPVDLSPDMIPVRLSQMLHDIAFRAPIIEAEKIFGDAGFRNEITKHYGNKYAEGLKPYLQGLAGAEGIPSKAFGVAKTLSEYFRQNVISAYIGFNPYTALKHGPTALVLSMKQVGVGEFLGAMRDLYRRSDDINLSNKEFVDKWSEEVGRRHRHWQDTIIGEHANIYGEGNLRERVMEKGSWLVAQSDMFSVRPTWLAAYREAVRKGDDHGLAVDQAEAAVRKAHGSTAITNQPVLVTGGGPMHGWLTSIYGFFGTVMQRRIELAHAVNDAYQLGKGGDIAGVAKAMPDITARTFAYVIWPTLVEEWVTGLTTEDKRGWGTHILTGALAGLASSVLYIRDIAGSLLHGYEPSVGLATSPFHDIANLTRDLKQGKKMFTKEHAGKLVGDFTTVFGEFTGLASKEIGSLLRAGVDLSTGQAKPKSFTDWRMLLTRGQTKKREVK